MTADAGERGEAGDADDADDAATVAAGARVLVVADHPNPEKVRRHYGPLAAVTAGTTLVCAGAGGDGASAATATADVDGLRVVEAPARGVRPLGILAMLPLALREATRGEYDLLVAVSLVPYGSYALAVGAATGLPTHLGIIGSDLDVHATARYGALARAALRRFDSVSVPGTGHRDRLVDVGVPPDRASILTNPVDASRYPPRPDPGRPVPGGIDGVVGGDADDGDDSLAAADAVDRGDAAAPATGTYDLVWVGRLAPEKDPLSFVAVVDELATRGVDVDAALVGGGPEAEAVRAAVRRRGLADHVTLPGWVDDPRDYYYRARLFVLTSERDALPLSLVEAMATGLPAVVPRVGSVTDVAVDGRTAVVVDERTPAAFADAIEALLADPARRASLAAAATAVRDDYSYDAARDDWRRIVAGAVGRRA